jgi:hypothetical protein
LSKSPPNRRQGHPPTGRGLVTTHPRDGCVATSKKVCLSGVNERILDKLPGKDLLRPCTHKSRALCRKLRRSSAAVATSREGQRPPRSGRAGQNRRWGRACMRPGRNIRQLASLVIQVVEIRGAVPEYGGSQPPEPATPNWGVGNFSFLDATNGPAAESKRSQR